MYTRDYILRLIERFALTLIAIRNRLLGREADVADVLPQLREVARQAGLDLEIARKLDPASLLIWLAPTEDVDPLRLWLMAELLYLEGLYVGLAAEEGGRQDLHRALAIYRRLPQAWKLSDDFAPVAERVSEIQKLLGD